MLLKKRARKLGPADDGRRMSLADYEFVKVQPGFQFELSRGVVTVSDVPNPPQGDIVDRTRLQMDWYRRENPGVINSLRTGSECKLLVNEFESERHPDLAVYKKAPKNNNREVWRIWLPEIVIEVVSLSSRFRDYVEQREEYLQIGINEYWIVDEKKACMTVLRRRGKKWREQVIHPGETYTTPLLPGFEFNLAEALGL